MNSISPVHSKESVHMERVIALDQPEYFPIVILPVIYSDGMQGMAVRFRFTDEERQNIAAGADLLVTELTFGGSRFTPISLEVVHPEVVE
jgi:hypothetical protein